MRPKNRTLLTVITGHILLTYRRIVSKLVKEGLVQSESHHAPLKIGFPMHVLRFYFPDLFDPSVPGESNSGGLS